MTKRKKKLSAILLGAILALGVGVSLAPKDAISASASTTVASFSRSGTTDTVTGGTFSAQAESKNGYYQDGTGTERYVQILSSTPFWVDEPSEIKFSAKVGGGTGDKTFDSGYYVLVSLLNASGSVITASTTTVTQKITTATGDDYTVDIPLTGSVYGVRLSHKKVTSYNVRYFSFSLNYTAGGGSGGEPIDATQVNVTAAGGATTVGVNKTLQLSAAVIPAGADQTVTWSSSNNSYATVNSSSGLVTGVATGNVVITATSTTPSITGTISLDVIIPVENPSKSFSITKSDFNSTSYAANNNEKTATADGADYKWETNQIMLQGNDMQWQKNGAALWNKTALGSKISSIEITGSETSKLAVYFGNAVKPTSGNVSGSNGVFTPSSDSTYFRIYNGDATSKTTLVKVNFEIIPAKNLTTIEVITQPGKTSYFTGDIFDGTGMVVQANFDNESHETITPVLPTTPLTADQTSVEISYTYKTVTKTTTVPITVTSRSITGIEVTTNPSKMTYRVGDVFDPTGMVVKATYDLGPAVDNYTNYTFTPTAAFGAVGKTNITIVSSDDSSKSTMLEVNVLEALAEGTYTIESNASGYMGTWSPSDLNIEKSEPSMGNLIFSNVDNVKLNAGPVTGPSFCFGGTSAAGKFTITLPDGMVATAVTFDGLSVGADATTPTLKINAGVSLTYSPSITSETLHPFANSLEISSFGSSRIWTSSIEIKAAFNAAAAAQSFGALFTEKTSEECAKVYGKDGNTFKVSIWNEMELIYNKADKAVQDSIKLGEPDVEGNDLEKAIATYVYIVNKYKYVDFIGIVNPSGTKDVLFEMNENNTIMLIVIVSLIGVTALGGVFYLRKKEQN